MQGFRLLFSRTERNLQMVASMFRSTSRHNVPMTFPRATTHYTLVTSTLLVAMGGVLSCQNSAKTISAPESVRHVSKLVETTKSDVEEIRTGLPLGAKALATLYRNAASPREDLDKAAIVLKRARDSVQDLRVAKSTFFALVDADGTIIRSDRTPDLMAGKNLWASVPASREVLGGKHVEVHGQLPEAAGTKGKPDGEWFVLEPVSDGEKVAGAYVTGWAWSAYAYRLETALRDELKTAARERDTKVPLAYVYILVAGQAYGAPVSPEVNGSAIVRAMANVHLSGDNVWSSLLEITGRDYGVAAKRAPELGAEVAIAVIRSET